MSTPWPSSPSLSVLSFSPLICPSYTAFSVPCTSQAALTPGPLHLLFSPRGISPPNPRIAAWLASLCHKGFCASVRSWYGLTFCIANESTWIRSRVLIENILEAFKTKIEL